MQEIYASWSLMTEPGDSMAGYLRRNLGAEASLQLIKSNLTAKELYNQLPEDQFRPIQFLESLQDSLECYRRRLKAVSAAKALAAIHKLGGELVTPDSWHWPKSLNDLGDSAPAALWVIGSKDILIKEESLAVVGARLASSYGLKLTSELVRMACSNQWVIVSGGALGIDAMAHKSALANSGKTIAVMAGGLDFLYPPANVDLLKELCQTGLLISELAPGIAATRWRFLQRNRLIAALAKATLVVEAGYRSGTINTAGHANELGRRVGAVPGPVDSVRSAGCHRLIREHRAELIATPGHLIDLMGGPDEVISTPTLPTNLLRTLDSLGKLSLQSDQIALASGLTKAETEHALYQLQQRNLVRQNTFGWQKI
jgi:DNA processing protein